MNLKSLANAVTSKAGRQILVARKHSPVILFVAGTVGVIGAAVLASRATLKLHEVLDEAQEDLHKAESLKHAEYTEEDRKRDKVIIYARTTGKIAALYGPAVGVGALSILALTGSHVILTKRNAAIAAAYAALDQGFRKYRERVVKEFGIEKDRELRYDMQDRVIVEETDEGPKTVVIKQPGPDAGIYSRMFDESNPNWKKEPYYNQFFIQSNQNYANDLLNARGHVFLNDVLDMLGFPRSKEGAVIGWLKVGAGDGFIDFGVFEGDRHSGMRFVKGEERSILLDFNVDPGVIWDKI